jgi:serine O-acetyltransferase
MVTSRNPLKRFIYPYTCAGIQVLILHRLTRWNMYTHIPVVYQILNMILRVMTSAFQVTWGIMISNGCDIGRGLYIAHHGRIWIGVKKMGPYCNIAHSVTIGRTEKETGYPVIGENVYFGMGCLVFGNITIGDNSIIGPYSIVRKDVPPDTLVMVSPPKMFPISKEESSSNGGNIA